MDRTPSVVALGHAIVDVIATCDDAVLESLGLTKGTMRLVEGDEAEKLYAAMTPETVTSGGSAANTAAALASLGAAVRFVGKVAADPLGRAFSDDIQRIGVGFGSGPAGPDTAGPAPGTPQSGTPPLGTSQPGTGRCLVFVTPDAEKTMCTSLGIAATLGAAEVDTGAVAAARVMYFEGYLCKDETEAALEAALGAATGGGTLVAMSASDPAWVELRRDAMTALLPRVDILLANEPEALGLAGTSDLALAIDTLLADCPTVAVTLGADGCVVARRGRPLVEVPAAPVAEVVDTTGAGDNFAAGFLYGVVNDLDIERSARLGALAAAEVVGHLGARPVVSLARLAAESGLLPPET